MAMDRSYHGHGHGHFGFGCISAVCMWGWVSVQCACEVEYQCTVQWGWASVQCAVVRLSISALCMWRWKPPAARQSLLSAAFRPDQTNPAPCTCCIFSPFLIPFCFILAMNILYSVFYMLTTKILVSKIFILRSFAKVLQIMAKIKSLHNFQIRRRKFLWKEFANHLNNPFHKFSILSQLIISWSWKETRSRALTINYIWRNYMLTQLTWFPRRTLPLVVINSADLSYWSHCCDQILKAIVFWWRFRDSRCTAIVCKTKKSDFRWRHQQDI